MLFPGIFRNKIRTGYEIIFRTTLEIKEYVEFEFYDYCWCWDSPQMFTHENNHLGIWFGVAHIVVQAMVYYVMRDNGKVVYHITVSLL